MIIAKENHKQNAPATQFQRNICASRFLFSNEEWASLSHSLKFSSRELQIVQGIFSNQTERQTAICLGISHHTIHTYLGRLYRKLNVGDRCELLISVFTEFRRQQDLR